MKAAVWHGARDIRIEQQPDPEWAGPGEALVRVALAGICGTDLHEYASPRAFAEIPLVDVVELGFDELTRPDTKHAKIHIRPG